MHFMVLTMATYTLRYRTLNKPSILAVGTAYYLGFTNINNIAYKLIVDKPVIDEARKMGLGNFVQPNGTTRPRLLNY